MRAAPFAFWGLRWERFVAVAAPDVGLADPEVEEVHATYRREALPPHQIRRGNDVTVLCVEGAGGAGHCLVEPERFCVGKCFSER